MKRASRIVIALVVIVVGVLAAGVAILNSLDFNQYRDFVANKVYEATGRKLAIAGDLDLAISFSPSLRLEGVTLANADWGSRPEMVKLGRLDAQVELIPLLSGEARITRIEISDLDALVETNADGQGNWQFGKATAPAAETSGGGESLPITPVVDEVVIENAKVTYRDGATGQTHSVVFESLMATAQDPSSPIDLTGAGEFAGSSFHFTGQVGNIAALTAGDNFPFTLNASALAAELSLEGVVEKPKEDAAIDVKIDMTVPDLTETMQTLATVVPDLQGVAVPVVSAAVSGHVQRSKTAISVTNLAISLGSSDLSGSAKVDLSGARPRISSELTSKTLDLAELMPTEDAPMAPAPADTDATGSSGEPKRLFSSEPLPLDGLRAVDANVTAKVGRFIVPSGLTAENMLSTAVLDRAKLTVTPFRADLAGGSLEGKFDLNGAQDTATTEFSLTGKDIMIGKALDQTGAKDLLSDGPADVDILLKGQGASMAALMGSLNGHVTLEVGKGRLHSKAVEVAGADVLGQLVDVLNPATEKQEYSELSCAVVRFNVKDGVATADNGIAAETDKVNVVGAGTIDLGDEMLDLTVVPQANSGIGINLSSAVASLVRIKGPLAEPSVGIDSAGAAKAAVSVGAALAKGGLSVLGEALLEKQTRDEHPCLTALGKAPPQEAGTPAKAPAEKPAGAVESTKEEAKKAIQGVGKAIDNIFGGKK